MRTLGEFPKGFESRRRALITRWQNGHQTLRIQQRIRASSVAEQLAYTKIRPRDPYSPHVVPLGQPAPKSMFRGNCPHLPLIFFVGGGSEDPFLAAPGPCLKGGSDCKLFCISEPLAHPRFPLAVSAWLRSNQAVTPANSQS